MSDKNAPTWRRRAVPRGKQKVEHPHDTIAIDVSGAGIGEFEVMIEFTKCPER